MTLAAGIQQTCALYADAFAGRTDRIPLIVTPKCGSGPSREELIHDTEAAVRKAAESLGPKAAVGADWIPSVNISWYQCIAVPSLLGARSVYPPGSEPIVEPIYRNAVEAAEAGVPPVGGPVIEEMLRTVDAALRGLPEGFALSFPPVASPFDLAQLLLPGDEYLVALVEDPDALGRFLDNLATLCIQVLDLVRERLKGTPGEHVTNRGIWFPGVRLPSDALVNWPPESIRQVGWPVLERFGRRYGKLCIHYCSKPAPSGHVLPALCGCASVGAVDTWQGPDAFIGDTAPGRMQSQVSLVFDMDLSSDEKIKAFLANEAVRGVPRKGGRALVLGAGASTVEEGKRIYERWRALGV